MNLTLRWNLWPKAYLACTFRPREFSAALWSHACVVVVIICRQCRCSRPSPGQCLLFKHYTTAVAGVTLWMEYSFEIPPARIVFSLKHYTSGVTVWKMHWISMPRDCTVSSISLWSDWHQFQSCPAKDSWTVPLGLSGKPGNLSTLFSSQGNNHTKFWKSLGKCLCQKKKVWKS